MTTDEFTLRDFDRIKGGVTFRSYPFNPGQSAKAYGAEGDGVTDDTTAVQNALDGVSQVFFPEGTYPVTDLTLNAGNKITGNNAILVVTGTITFDASNVIMPGIMLDLSGATVAGSTPILQPILPENFTAARAQALLDGIGYLPLGAGTFALGTTGLTVDSGDKSIYGVGGVHTLVTYTGTGNAIDCGSIANVRPLLKDFKLQGTSNQGEGIVIGSVSNSCQAKIYTLDIRDFEIAIHCVNSQITQIRDCFIHSNTDGIQVGDGEDQYQTATLIDHCRIDANTGVGVRVRAAIGLEMVGNIIQSNGEEGVFFETNRTSGGFSIASTIFKHNYLEGNNLGRGSGFSEVRVDRKSGEAFGGAMLNTIVEHNVWGPLVDSDYTWSFYSGGNDSYFWRFNRSSGPDSWENTPVMKNQYEGNTDTAAPTTGTHIAGEVVWNRAPSAANPPGWVCVTAGTPGTWKAMANLAS